MPSITNSSIGQIFSGKQVLNTSSFISFDLSNYPRNYDPILFNKRMLNYDKFRNLHKLHTEQMEDIEFEARKSAV